MIRDPCAGQQHEEHTHRAKRGERAPPTVVAWVALALIFSGLGGGTSAAQAQRVIASLSSTVATQGKLESRAVLATADYFRVTDRGSGIFALDPEKNLGLMVDAPEYFDSFNRDAADLGFAPTRNIPVLLTIATHEGAVPDAEGWLKNVTLAGGDVRVSPLPGYKIAYRSEHHLTLAVQFPSRDAAGHAVLPSKGTLALTTPDMMTGGNPMTITWSMPLATAGLGGPIGAGATLGGVLAIFAGLLVIFAPCAVHMTAYFLPLVTGLGMKEVLDRAGDRGFRLHVMSLGLAFVGGFVVLYTIFGVAAGLAGQFFTDTARLTPYVTPLRIFAGAVVIFMAFNAMGLFKLPFVINLAIPGKPHEAGTKTGYFAAVVSGMTISIGCLTCVGGSLLAALLIYAGASASPVTGGLTLFLFSAGMSIPFLLSAFAFQKFVPKFTGAQTLLRYSTTAAAALMLIVGLLIISGNDTIFERLVLPG